MSTTTIRLSDELKYKIACAADRVGTSAHSFILEAIAEKIDNDEKQNDFYEAAQQRYAKIIASGKTIPWEQMRHYLEDRATGKKISRPPSKKLAR